MAPRRDEFEGTWRLLSRIDRAADGSIRDEPSLGSDPIATVTYAAGHFAAQFMKRDRSTAMGSVKTSNNTGAVGGYDAYFGTYARASGEQIAHTLEASLTPANVGMTVMRSLNVVDGCLITQLATSTASAEPVTRTITWERLA